MNRNTKLSLLIVDDQTEILDVYQDVLHGHWGHEVDCACLPAEAARLVRDRLFDMVLLDAKIPYKGAMLGGLLLAEELGRVLGTQAILLMSQYDVRGEVAHFNPSYSFLPKPRDGRTLVAWAERELLAKIHTLVVRQYGFVVMPFGVGECDAWYRDSLSPCMTAAGYDLTRMDEISTTKAINVELLHRIREAHFVVVYAPAANPNVYFEAGYANALDKFILLFATAVENLPFDVRANRVFRVSQTQDDNARQELLNFMAGLRGVKPPSKQEYPSNPAL